MATRKRVISRSATVDTNSRSAAGRAAVAESRLRRPGHRARARTLLECSIGIMAYNEEANIGHLLGALIDQQTTICSIREIIVLASGCTDGTEAIVRDWARRDRRIKLVVQSRREGKASALNLFVQHSRCEILVLAGADTLPTATTIERLVEPFIEPDVGMTGGRPIPINDPSRFMGFAAHFLWTLHHQVALKRPKLGELTAFRRVFLRIPFNSATDEANIEPLICGQGYELRYVPESIVYNRGPATLNDFLKQRRRIHAGHLRIYRKQGYAVSTLSTPRILEAIVDSWGWDWPHLHWMLAIIALEAYARLLGWIDDKFGQTEQHMVWDIATSTKGAITR